MNTQEFLQHVTSHSSPEGDWSPALQAIWYAENGEWKRAHELCQQGDTPEGAWVHANLHRQEGDLSNAEYWYNRAGKSERSTSVEDERHEIISALLSY